MSHLSRTRHFRTEGALRSQRDPVFRGLTVNQILAAMSRIVGGILVRHFRAQAVALLAHHEQQSNKHSVAAQSLGGGKLRCDDSLGITRAASVNSRLIF